ncbi:MAG: NHL domain-containing thioredoxin family protein [Candidatus Nanopelagicales bacterium]
MARVRAPELVGRGGWINTDRPLTLHADLRGKIVLLDFWTFCCINCLHVLDELRPVEEKYSDVLVTVGVHSPKFVHEADHEAVVTAVERYAVAHPVLDDPDLTTWKAYAVRAWPTLALVDPEGYVVAQFSGEGHAHALDRHIADLVSEHQAKGTLHRGDGPYVAPQPEPSTMRFPAKLVRLDDGRLLVADAGHHEVVELEADGETVLRRFTGFREPNGLALLPTEVAQQVGYDVVVADTVHHELRGIRLDGGAVMIVAGTGAQWMQADPSSGPATKVPLSSPWDVVWFGGRVAVAMAGIHQLWWFDPITQAVGVLAGTTNEGLRDGPAEEAWFAQPSGLAVAAEADGERLWFVDAETSSVRSLRAGTVMTAVGQGLFEFGHVDGPAEDALLQHPLGVCVLPDGSIAVLDTYNGAVRRYEPQTSQVTTLATGLREPSDAVVVDGELLVVESAAHRLTRVRLPDEAVRVDAAAHRTHRPASDVVAGAVELVVVFEPPAGQKLDDRYGPPTRLLVSSTPQDLLAAGAGSGSDLQRTIVFSDRVADGVLHVAAFAASCDEGDVVEFPACHVHQQDWGVPVRVTHDGAQRVALVLSGLDA